MVIMGCEGEQARYETVVFHVSVFNRAIISPLHLYSSQTMSWKWLLVF